MVRAMADTGDDSREARVIKRGGEAGAERTRRKRLAKETDGQRDWLTGKKNGKRRKGHVTEEAQREREIEGQGIER